MDRFSITIPLLHGIKVKIHWSLALIMLFITYMVVFNNPLYMIFFGMYGIVILHELAHVYTARYYGIHCSEIVLNPIGSYSDVNRDDGYPMHDLLISIAGPALNFTLGVSMVGLGWLIAYLDIIKLSFLYDILMIYAQFNFTMGIYHLWPIFPLDGGRILRSVLTMIFSYESATLFVSRFTQIASSAGLVYYWREHEYFSAVYMLFSVISAQAELENMRAKKRFGMLEPDNDEDSSDEPSENPMRNVNIIDFVEIDTDDEDVDKEFRDLMDYVDNLLDKDQDDNQG